MAESSPTLATHDTALINNDHGGAELKKDTANNSSGNNISSAPSPHEIFSSSPHNDTSATLQMNGSSTGSHSSSSAAVPALMTSHTNLANEEADEGGSTTTSSTPGPSDDNRSLSPSSLPLHDNDQAGSDTDSFEGKLAEQTNNESFQEFLDYINSDDNTTKGRAGSVKKQQQKPSRDNPKDKTKFYETRRSSNDSTVRTSNLNLKEGRRLSASGGSTRTLDTSLKSYDCTLEDSEGEGYVLRDSLTSSDAPQSRQPKNFPIKSRLQREKETNQRQSRGEELQQSNRDSLRLSDVFDPTELTIQEDTNSHTTDTGTTNNNVTSSTNHSLGNSLSKSELSYGDSSSLLLDISWGSNLFDRATVLSSLEEVMMANPHMKLDTGGSGGGVDREKSGGSGGGGLLDSSRSGALLDSSRSDSRGFGRGMEVFGGSALGTSSSVTTNNTASSNANNRKGGRANLAAMAPIAISYDDDTTMIPPTFRTRRRSTTDSNATGDGASVPGNLLGEGGRRLSSVEGGRLRNNPLRNSKNGSFRGSKNSGKSDEDNTNMEPIVHVDGGGDSGGSEYFSRSLGFKESSSSSGKDRSSRSGSMSDKSSILGSISSVGVRRGNRRRPSSDSMSSLGSGAVAHHHHSASSSLADTPSRIGRSVVLSNSRDLLGSSLEEQDHHKSLSTRSRLSQFSNKTASSVGVDDMDLSVGNFSHGLQTPNDGGGGEDGDDREMLAAVGGTAYLKASKKVWAMRIIVIATFVVVSIIVTVLIYKFFHRLETNTLNDEFAMLAVSLTRNMIELLDRKTFSLNVLATNYEGILGMQTNITVPPGDHASSVMLSDEARVTCGDAVTTNNRWKTDWPFVTLPGYESYSESMLNVTEDRAVFFAPVVPDENVSAWEDYARRVALESEEGAVAGGIRTPSGDIFEYGVTDADLIGGSNQNRRFSQRLRRVIVTDEGHFNHDTEAAKVNTVYMDENAGSLPVRVPIWQLSSTQLYDESLMWDVYKYPPYTEALDRILQAQSSSSATNIIPCSDLLIPFQLTNPPSREKRRDAVMEYTDGTTTGEYNVDHTIGQNADGHIDEDGAQGQSVNKGVCSAIFQPVHSSSAHGFHNSAHVAGVVASLFSWEDLLTSSSAPVRRPAGHRPMTAEMFVVVTTKYDESLPFESYQSAPATYYVTETGAEFRGMGRNIEQRHADMMLKYDFKLPLGDVVYSFEVYPTDVLFDSYEISNKPTFLALIACCFVVLSTLVFFVYDYFVNYRQKVIIQQAAQTTRIVHSLYPAFVRDNLFKNEGKPSQAASVGDEFVEDRTLSVANEPGKRKLKMKVSDLVDTPANQLKRFLSHPIPSKNYDLNMVSELDVMDPIAEVFENTTVMIADIEGFTAWCSEREPTQVFRLLETVYRAFDLEGSKAGVFKVETVGDSYVAVTGLPDAREDHAVSIAKYSIKCLLKFNVLAKRLEPLLGPGTASLGMRFGLHSGPVTAGVLRGEKSRFQLFGDTINVASRMESTGEKNMIQVSQDTADLLTSAGKGHWLVPRDNPVSAKGKGLVQTYWLQPNKRRPSMNTASMRLSVKGSNEGYGMSAEGEEIEVHRALSQSWKNINIENGVSIAKERLIRWNVAILESFLLKIMEQRNAKDKGDDPASPSPSVNDFTPSEDDKVLSFTEKLCEKVMFPDDSYSEEYPVVLVGTSINPKARAQLLEYVAIIASMYRDVPFHNFDHASHVTMSANKLLNRVCTAFVSEAEDFASVAARTFGISADPLAQFVIVFSSLVHDVDHQGVPNAQLVKEHDPLCEQYDNRSVAEKRSIAIAWNVLMEDRFIDLQRTIFTNSREMMRFRQLLMNTVLATDIADKERSTAGKIRWQKAFHPSDPDVSEDTCEKKDDASNNNRSLKATLVFEQIMQASDVSHTMQHWHTFKKWNKRLYSELSKAYREGRGATDPRENWYGGEIGFFDFYIIPLAKKLRECGVFGSAASEYLDYAVENRRRWEEEGKEIASKMVKDYDALHLREDVLDEEDSNDLQREEANDEGEDFGQSGLSSIMSYNEGGS